MSFMCVYWSIRGWKTNSPRIWPSNKYNIYWGLFLFCIYWCRPTVVNTFYIIYFISCTDITLFCIHRSLNTRLVANYGARRCILCWKLEVLFLVLEWAMNFHFTLILRINISVSMYIVKKISSVMLWWWWCKLPSLKPRDGSQFVKEIRREMGFLFILFSNYTKNANVWSLGH